MKKTLIRTLALVLFLGLGAFYIYHNIRHKTARVEARQLAPADSARSPEVLQAGDSLGVPGDEFIWSSKSGVIFKP